MRRRDFIAVLAGASAWMSAARAQEPRRVIGVLGSTSYGGLPGVEPAFVQGFKEAGFIEGKNIGIEWRWAERHYDHLPSLVGELLERNVSVIVAFDAPAAFAAKAATKTIPIVFLTGTDPVSIGLVQSVNRPGGNLTGVSILNAGPKCLEILHELVPVANTTALLVNPSNPNAHALQAEIEVATKASGQRLEVLKASGEDDLETALTTMVQQRADVLVVMPDAFFIARRERLVALVARRATPAIYPIRYFPEVGGLISYGAPLIDLAQQMGIYTGKILKGAKPADIPVQQSTRLELVINLKTAKALGLTVPPSLLARADEVIE
jgi:putative tryptophan/tyrosine transport system substrate-binding protein